MKTKDMVYIAIFSALMAICSWLTITLPIAAVPFTLQTFAVFLALLVLGGKRGTIAILVYIGIGMVGLPVFANFKGGLATLFSSTGGYIFGFIAQGVIYIVMCKVFGEKTPVKIIALILGLFACYAFGTAWFVQIYTKNSGEIGYVTALSWCVIPYIVPDLLKMALAITISKRLEKNISFSNT